MKRVLITHQYFLPAYKAGGPIQSIANLCRHLYKEFEFFIICGNTDHNEMLPLPGIPTGKWIDFENGKARVQYISGGFKSRRLVNKLIEEVKPDYVFINGIYSPLFTIAPLLNSQVKKIVSARGMLHPGALSQKSFKKKVFLFFLKLIRAQKKVSFHATDESEKKHIQKIFGDDVNVIVAQNFPNIIRQIKKGSKQKGSLKLASVALISPMKNHELVLQALKEVKSQVQYDIYGPVKDKVYWGRCLKIIENLPANITVTYKGSIEPAEVENTLAGYHCFIQPSKSENFGHAIYEAMALGLPVITSFFTPWNGLEKEKAGWNVDISNLATLINAIEEAALLDQQAYDEWSRGAVAYVRNHIDTDTIKKQYRILFS